jgi:hypothetical protein
MKENIMTLEQKKVAYWKWVNDMVLINMMANMGLHKKHRSDFQSELPDTDDVETQYQFMLNYNTNKAQELNRQRAELRGY